MGAFSLKGQKIGRICLKDVFHPPSPMVQNLRICDKWTDTPKKVTYLRFANLKKRFACPPLIFIRRGMDRYRTFIFFPVMFTSFAVF